MTRTLILAEIGSNHNGDFRTAKKLIRAAKDAGANVAKFQLFTADGLCHRTHPAYDTVAKYALQRGWVPDLAEYAWDIGIGLTATPCDFKAVDLLDKLNVPWIKIASGDLNHHALIGYAARTKRHLIISTGMATRAEVRQVLNVALSEGAHVTLLQCVVAYPATASQSNLYAMQAMHEDFGVPVGFSDHTISTTLPAVAVGMGATVIEKHLTLSRAQEGPDHPHSLEPHEFKQMVEAIREAESALGTSQKQPLEIEMPFREIARRGLYFAKDLPAGHVLQPSDVVAVRPLVGIGAEYLDSVTTLYHTCQTVQAGEPVTWENLRTPL